LSEGQKEMSHQLDGSPCNVSVRQRTVGWWLGEQNYVRHPITLSLPNTSTSGTTMNKDQIAGKAKQVKGDVKETVGKLFDDKTLENEGKAQNTVGKIQQGYGDIKDDVN